ncbi:MAG: S8 family serine peptidase [Leptolyngbyaceae bacterium]|nr:S8 family serine peptidase [Leptolyngbyaceae bacterium]
MDFSRNQNKFDVSDSRSFRLRGGQSQVRGSLSPDNRSDLYSVSIRRKRLFRATLNRLTHNATLTVFDESGDRLAKSKQRGTRSETIHRTLEPGTYLFQVRGVGRRPQTNYKLRLVAQSKTDQLGSSSPDGSSSSELMTAAARAPVDAVGNTLSTALNVGVVSGTLRYEEAVGNLDQADFYQIALGDRQLFSLSLDNLVADADLALFNRAGTLIQNSLHSGTQQEFITQVLNPGQYFIRVSQFSGETRYRLTLSANSTSPNPFNAQVGYGLLNATSAVIQSGGLAQPTFQQQSELSPDIPWGVERINARDVWEQGTTGKGVTVAVLDSGVDFTHIDLDDNIWINSDEIPGNGIDDDGNGYIDDRLGWDFVDGDGRPMDLEGHGTHVAGTIAAERNGFGVTGVAPDAAIMAVRVLDEEGQGFVSDIVRGLYYAINNGADVINLSLGGNSPTPEIRTAIRDAFNLGIPVIMAAGNEGRSVPSFPAQFAAQWGIAVGASDRTDRFANFSNQAGFTPLDYVVAPGVSIPSTLPGDRYGLLSGTSMATPHVAGTVALMLDANPTLTPSEVETILINTATTLA